MKSSLVFVCLQDGISRPKVELSVCISTSAIVLVLNFQQWILHTERHFANIAHYLLPRLGENPVPLLEKVIQCFVPTGQRPPYICHPGPSHSLYSGSRDGQCPSSFSQPAALNSCQSEAYDLNMFAYLYIKKLGLPDKSEIVFLKGTLINVSYIWKVWNACFSNFGVFYLLLKKFQCYLSEEQDRSSLVVQWLRIHLPVERMWVQYLVWEDPTCHEAAKPAHHDYWDSVVSP